MVNAQSMLEVYIKGMAGFVKLCKFLRKFACSF